MWRRPDHEDQRLDCQANTMIKFKAAYNRACGQTLNYTANGWAKGLGEFLAGKTLFGRSRHALAGDRVTRAKERCGGNKNLRIYTGFWSNGHRLQSQLDRHFGARPTTLAKISTGTITRWDDPALTALNTVTMPTEGSAHACSAVTNPAPAKLQSYLQAASGGAWTSGAEQRVDGGVGTGAEGDDGTSAAVKSTEGAISYNELSFALEKGLPANQDAGQSQNVRRCGSAPTRPAKPSRAPKSPGTGNDLVLDLSSFFVYQTRPNDIYPIVLATYEIVCSKYPTSDQSLAVKAFLQAAIGPSSSGPR